MKFRTILLAAFCLALCAADGPVRTWTDSTGKYTVEAELVGVDNGEVRLKRNDGSIVTVPLVKMSADDRAFLQQRLQELKDEAPNEHPPTDSTGSSNGEPTKTFNPEDFKLSDLVKDVQAGNHFKIPAKARPFLSEVLDPGADFQFKTTNRGGTKAYISHDLSPNIWINPSYPAERLGEAICHELLHFEDMKQFKPINAFQPNGLNRDQLKVFQPVVRDLVNIISHEYVKSHLEQFGYVEPLTDNADGRMKNMASGLAALENNFVSVSQQLAKTPGKKGAAGMGGIQTVYQNLLLMTLRDQLLFDRDYASDIDEMIVRFQAILDFIHQNTSEDPRFKKVYLEVQGPARSIRTSCQQYQRSSGSTEERYALLKDTLDHIYDRVGISFELIPRPSEAPVLKPTSATFQPGESFVLDGQFNFSDVRIFVPGVTDRPVAPPTVTERPPADRAALVKELIARGDAAPENEKHFAYQLALRYSPDDEAIKSKLTAPRPFSRGGAAMKKVELAISKTTSDDYRGWPKPTPEIEVTELHLLLDKQLAGDLSFIKANVQGMKALLMLSAPDRTVEEVISMHGPPTNDKTRGGTRILTYGRIRLIDDAKGKVILVLMSPN